MVLHELRHAYQHNQIDLYCNDLNKEDESIILKWDYDLVHKKQHMDSSAEIDANKFAYENFDKV